MKATYIVLVVWKDKTRHWVTYGDETEATEVYEKYFEDSYVRTVYMYKGYRQ